MRKLIWLLLLATPALAQDAKLGSIDFPTAATGPAQDAFIEGTLLLHSFEYEDAAEAYQKAQSLDSTLAMAYWGEAMTHSHLIWHRDYPEKAQAALNKLAPTPEERARLAGPPQHQGLMKAADILFGDGNRTERVQRYSDFMGTLHQQFPDNLEIQSLYALSILGSSTRNRETVKYMKAAAIAEDVFIKNPDHPGALHYLIHSYDDPIHAPLGLRAAERYAKVAPSASHALHMPSHIFVALGMWDQVVASNVDSWEASLERVERKNLGPNDKGYHALWWLAYGYLQRSEVDKAREMFDIVDNHNSEGSTPRMLYHRAAIRAAFVVDSELWDDPIAMTPSDVSESSLELEAMDRFTTGYAAYHRGDFELLRQERDALRNRRTSDNPATISLNGPAELPEGSPPGLQAAYVMETELDALILAADDDLDGAIKVLETATTAEEGMAFMFGPPKVVKPAPELLGDMLVKAGRQTEAHKAYARSLARAPGRRLSTLKTNGTSSP